MCARGPEWVRDQTKIENSIIKKVRGGSKKESDQKDMPSEQREEKNIRERTEVAGRATKGQ